MNRSETMKKAPKSDKKSASGKAQQTKIPADIKRGYELLGLWNQPPPLRQPVQDGSGRYIR